MQFYIDVAREHDPHALPDAETFYMTADEFRNTDSNTWLAAFDQNPQDLAGWYWWSCFPGCLPDGEPVGPFKTEQEAIEDARG